MKPDATALSWAAGIFEGEGTITIAVRNQDRTFRLVCIMSNTDRQMISIFHTWFDGWVQPAYGERPGRKPAWSWTVSGPAAVKFLEQVSPYFRTLRVRRKCDLAFHFRETQEGGAGPKLPGVKAKQEHLYAEMKERNRRGVA